MNTQNESDIPNISFVEANNSEIQKRIRAEKLRLLYKNLILSIPANFICATVIFIGLYSTTYQPYIISWYAAVSVISLLRLTSLFFYLRHKYSDQFYSSIFNVGVIISALLWGIVYSLLIPPNALIQQMILIVIGAGITAGGAQSLQANLNANRLHIILIVLPLCVWLFIQNSMAYTVLGFAMTTYLIFMLVTAKRSYQLLSQVLDLHYQKLELINHLSITNKQLEKSFKAQEETQANLRTIIDNAPIGMAIISLDEKWQQVNHALCDIVGYTEAELEKLTLKDICDPNDHTVEESIQDILHGKLSADQLETRFKHKDGQHVWVQLSFSLIRDQLGKPLYFIFQIQDISGRKHNERILADLHKQTQRMIDELKQREHEMNLINKMNEMLQICKDSNEAYSTIQFTAEELFSSLDGALIIYDKLNNRMETVKQWPDNNTSLKTTFSIEDCWSLRGGYPYVVNDPKQEILCEHFTSQPKNAYLCMPLMVRGGIIGILYLSTSHSEGLTEHQQQVASAFSEVVKLALANIRLRETLHDQAIHDPLTGLFNRRFLNELLPTEIQKTIFGKTTLCIGMIDLDYFKKLNDNYGHDAGDEVLRFIGAMLKQSFKDAIPFRYGGEEFLIVLTETDLVSASTQFEKLRLAVQNTTLTFRDQTLPKFTLSVGIAEAPKHGKTASEVIHAADEALYHAKQTGRNRVITFDHLSTYDKLRL